MDSIARTAEQSAVIEEARAYVEQIGIIDLTNAGQVSGHLMAAEVLLTKITQEFPGPTSRVRINLTGNR